MRERPSPAMVLFQLPVPVMGIPHEQKRPRRTGDGSHPHQSVRSTRPRLRCVRRRGPRDPSPPIDRFHRPGRHDQRHARTPQGRSRCQTRCPGPALTFLHLQVAHAHLLRGPFKAARYQIIPAAHPYGAGPGVLLRAEDAVDRRCLPGPEVPLSVSACDARRWLRTRAGASQRADRRRV